MAISARQYAEVAARKVWSDVLLKLGLRERAAEAYDEAVIRAAWLSLDFEWAPVETPVGWSCEHLNITGSRLRDATCYSGCRMRPVFASERTSA